MRANAKEVIGEHASGVPMRQGEAVNVLVVNAGSSSLRLRLLGPDDQVLASVDEHRVEPAEMVAVLGRFLQRCQRVDAVGHRIVHGGPAFERPTLVDDRVEESLWSLVDLAPLHNPPGLAGIRAMRSLRPPVPQVACFDTAFHAHLPPAAATYAVPQAWRDRWPLRRFGFHGLSHAWAVHRAAQLLGRPVSELRLVTAHLGAGASLAAVHGGRSVDTTMGFTPLEGLVMATRSGSVDPGLVLWVQHRGGLSAQEVERALETESGLAGLSGVSGDLREVLAELDRGDERAVLAYGVYLHRLRAGIAAMTAAMAGMDGLVFTGGAGEGSWRLRADVCRDLEYLGVLLEGGPNGTDWRGDGVLSPTTAQVPVVVVEAREDLEIARQVRGLLART